MPTRGRQRLAQLALLAWERQDWSNRELVIVDDRDEPSFPVAPAIPGVQYVQLTRRLSVGEKRNIACSRANGDVIIHWDSDDWSAPDRITRQMALLEQAPFVGYHTMLFVDEPKREAWRYVGATDYALGTSFCYHRFVWEENPFPAVQVGEDNSLVEHFRPLSCDAGRTMVARIHGGNTDPKLIVGSGNWRKVEWPDWWRT